MKLHQYAVGAFAAAGLAMSFGASEAKAEDTPFIGQIMWTANTFCPRNWAETSGQMLPISSYQALFSLIGCEYGGNCQTTMALPDLRGRAMVGADGQAPIGSAYGTYQHTMTVQEMPAHSHTLRASDRNGTLNDPLGQDLAEFPAGAIYSDQTPNGYTFGSGVISQAGGGQPFSTYQPTLTMRACIALSGIFPPRS